MNSRSVSLSVAVASVSLAASPTNAQIDTDMQRYLETSSELQHLFTERVDIPAGARGVAAVAIPTDWVNDDNAWEQSSAVFVTGELVPSYVDSGYRLAAEYDPLTPMIPQPPVRSRPPHESTDFEQSFTVQLPSPPTPECRPIAEFRTSRESLVWTVHVTDEGGAFRRRGTIYRDPAEQIEMMTVELPADITGTIQVTVRGPGDLPDLTGTIRFVPDSTRIATARPQVISTRRVAEGREYVLRLPPNVVADALDFHVEEFSFHRTVRVEEFSPGGITLAEQAIYRTDDTQVLRVPLARTAERLLRVVVSAESSSDGPIAIVLRDPVIVFRSDGQPATLMGATASYRGLPHLLFAREIQRDAPQLRSAPYRWPPDARSFMPASAWQHYFPAQTGAEIDPRFFRFEQRLELGSEVQALTRIRLEPSVLAEARADLSDLRVVDDEFRQRAFTLDRAVPMSREEVTPAIVETVNGYTTYQLPLGVRARMVAQVELQNAATYVDRDFEILGRLDSGSAASTVTRLAAGRLRRRPGREQPFVIALAPHRVTELLLRVRDGGDAPLIFDKGILTCESVDLVLAARAGGYRLLYGSTHATVASPRFELTESYALAVGTQVPYSEGSEPREVEDFIPPGDYDQIKTPNLVLWGILVLAVVVLFGVTLRVSRRPIPAPPDDSELATPSSIAGSEETTEPAMRSEGAAPPAGGIEATEDSPSRE